MTCIKKTINDVFFIWYNLYIVGDAMTKDELNAKLDKIINDLDNTNISILFPKILDALDYIVNQFKADFDKLSAVDQFMGSTEFERRKIKIQEKIVKYYLKTMYNVDVEILESNAYELSMACGGFNKDDGKIYYSMLGFLLGSQGPLSFLYTMMHESRHKIQDNASKSLDVLSFDPHMILLVKEMLMEDSKPEDNRKFYLDNYDELFYENDAENFARNGMRTFLDQLYDMYLEKNERNKLLEVKMAKIKNGSSISYRINPKVVKELQGSEITGTYKVDGAEEDKLIVIDKYIKAHPELVDKFPMLSIIFKGYEAKTYDDIVRDRELLKSGKSKEIQDRIDELYYFVIESDPIMALTDRIVKGENVIDYLRLHPTLIREYKEEVELLATKYDNDVLKAAVGKKI